MVEAAGAVEALAGEHHGDGAEQDAEVEPEAPVVDVPDVVADALVPADGVAAVDLGPARDARLDGEAPALEGADVDALQTRRDHAY